MGFGSICPSVVPALIAEQFNQLKLETKHTKLSCVPWGYDGPIFGLN